MTKKNTRGRLQREKAAYYLSTGKAKTIKEASLLAGYSPASANAYRVSQAEDWPEILQKYLPDIALLRKHKKLLTRRYITEIEIPSYVAEENVLKIASSVGKVVGYLFSRGVNKKRKEALPHRVTLIVDEPKTILDALSLAYSVKNKKSININTTNPLADMTDNEIETLINEQRETYESQENTTPRES